MGCALYSGTFSNSTGDGLMVSPDDLSLVHLVLNLLVALQSVGTVPAIDYDQYLRHARGESASTSELVGANSVSSGASHIGN